MADFQALRQKYDSHDIYGMICSMPSHLEDGLAIGRRVDLQRLEFESFHSVVIAGMGGSAIAGDLLRSYLYGTIQIPFSVIRHYRLPGFVNKKTLVICSSYSGDTEETLAAYDNAFDRGAKLIVITSGGKLANKAEHDGIPVIMIKGGLPPRAALGYSFAALLAVASRIGLCGDQYPEPEQAIGSLKRWMGNYGPDKQNNPAIMLAEKISGKIPIIYAGFERFDAVATRFKGQLNENAKSHAFVNIFPEMCHNELVGWQKLHDLDKKLIAIIIRDTQEHKRIRIRMEIVSDYLREKDFEVVILESQAGTELERMFYFIQYFDFTSYYLALLQGLDPYPIAPIDYLKNKLSKLN